MDLQTFEQIQPAKSCQKGAENNCFFGTMHTMSLSIKVIFALLLASSKGIMLAISLILNNLLKVLSTLT